MTLRDILEERHAEDASAPTSYPRSRANVDGPFGHYGAGRNEAQLPYRITPLDRALALSAERDSQPIPAWPTRTHTDGSRFTASPAAHEDYAKLLHTGRCWHGIKARAS
jgi:hypothetical protein